MICRWCKKPEPPDEWQHGVSPEVHDEMYCRRYWSRASACRQTERFAKDHLIDIIEAAEGVMSSCENYFLERKPVDEYDEYDVMMAPKWAKLRNLLKLLRETP